MKVFYAVRMFAQLCEHTEITKLYTLSGVTYGV